MQQIPDEKWRPAVHPGTDRQFGNAARWTAPLVSLLQDAQQHPPLTKYAHPVAITALVTWSGNCGREVVVRCGCARLPACRLQVGRLQVSHWVRLGVHLCNHSEFSH